MSVWQRVLGLARTVIETVVFDEELESIVLGPTPEAVPTALRALRPACPLV